MSIKHIRHVPLESSKRNIEHFVVSYTDMSDQASEIELEHAVRQLRNSARVSHLYLCHSSYIETQKLDTFYFMNDFFFSLR